MENFKFYAPTKVYFGKDEEQRVGKILKEFHPKKVLIHYGGQSAIKSGLLDRVKKALDEESIDYCLCGGVVANPLLSKVNEGIQICKEEGVDFILAVGEDSLLYYATGISPTANTRNVRLQASFASNNRTRTEVARRMFMERFDDVDVSSCSISDLMGKEGRRVKQLYSDMAEKYKVGWQGRRYVPGAFELSDITNKVLTSANAALYALITSSVFAMGFSPYLGFVHTGSPLPFVYDIADLYKEHLCIDFAYDDEFNNQCHQLRKNKWTYSCYPEGRK